MPLYKNLWVTSGSGNFPKVRYNAMCKQAELEKAGLSTGAKFTLGGAGTGAALGALIQAARGKSVLKGLGVGGLAGAGVGAGLGYMNSPGEPDMPEPDMPEDDYEPVAPSTDDGGSGSGWGWGIGGAAAGTAGAAGAWALLRRRGLSPKVVKQIATAAEKKSVPVPSVSPNDRLRNASVLDTFEDIADKAGLTQQRVHSKKHRAPGYQPSNRTKKRRGTATILRSLASGDLTAEKIVRNPNGMFSLTVRDAKGNVQQVYSPMVPDNLKGMIEKAPMSRTRNMRGNGTTPPKPQPGSGAARRSENARGAQTPAREQQVQDMAAQRQGLAKGPAYGESLKELPPLPAELQAWVDSGRKLNAVRGPKAQMLKEYNQLVNEIRAYNNKINAEALARSM